jgi:hypothetical protein
MFLKGICVKVLIPSLALLGSGGNWEEVGPIERSSGHWRHVVKQDCGTLAPLPLLHPGHEVSSSVLPHVPHHDL